MDEKNKQSLNNFIGQLDDGERIRLAFVRPTAIAMRYLIASAAGGFDSLDDDTRAILNFLSKTTKNPEKIRCSCCSSHFNDDRWPYAFVVACPVDEEKARKVKGRIVAGVCGECYENRPDWAAEAEAHFDELLGIKRMLPKPTISDVGHA